MTYQLGSFLLLNRKGHSFATTKSAPEIYAAVHINTNQNPISGHSLPISKLIFEYDKNNKDMS